MQIDRPSLLERVDDAAIVQLYCDGFTQLSRREKLLAWHLYQAALAGRDICYDQRYAHSLAMRELLEQVLAHAAWLEPDVRDAFRRYAKLFWIHSGPFNSLTARKFVLGLTPAQWRQAIEVAAAHGAVVPGSIDEPPGARAARLAPFFLDSDLDPVVTNKTPGPGLDILRSSANNFYVDVGMEDLRHFTERHGLNSRLVKREGRLIEEVWKIGGRYDAELRRITTHLRDAIPYAPPPMAACLGALIRFYETGEEADRVAYDIAWVGDDSSAVDTINGFIEVYTDPRGTKGAWEGIVYCINPAKTRQIETLAAHAQWFEDRMPWDARFRKPHVGGVTARAIDVIVETGDSGPMTAIGINLPNDQAVRERYGSKSVSLANVNDAYERSISDDMRREFSWSADEAERARRWGAFAQELATEMHEVIGHGSGQSAGGDGESPHLLLKEHYSAIEEARADLVALYWLPDPKLVELGLVSAEDHADLVQAEYESYARAALVQLRRMRQGSHLEEDHMRNRQLIVHWLLAQTEAVAVRQREGNTYYVMLSSEAFRDGVSRLLAEVQRIKSVGDYAAACALVDGYGVHFDTALRDEVVARVDALDLPSYTAFVMPRLRPVERDGEIADVEISYPCDFEAQMLEYSAFARGARSGVS